MRPRPLASAKCTGVALILACSAGCHRPSAPEPPPAAAEPLPEHLGAFQAGPLRVEDVAVRRTYTRGEARIDVTLARFPMTDSQYAQWVATSRESFPQASLDVGSSDANGFYQCAGGAEERCDLLVQLRSGVHIEIRAGGTAARTDVDAIAAGLPLRALARDSTVLDSASARRR